MTKVLTLASSLPRTQTELLLAPLNAGGTSQHRQFIGVTADNRIRGAWLLLQFGPKEVSRSEMTRTHTSAKRNRARVKKREEEESLEVKLARCYSNSGVNLR